MLGRWKPLAMIRSEMVIGGDALPNSQLDGSHEVPFTKQRYPDIAESGPLYQL